MTSSTVEEILSLLPSRIHRVHTETVHFDEAFLDIAGRFADRAGTVALLSGGALDCARYHILGIEPWVELRASTRSISVTLGGRTFCAETNPFSFLDLFLKRFALVLPSSVGPIATGLLGYFSYDLKDCLEVLPRTSVDDLGLPQLYLCSPRMLLVHDRIEDKTQVHLPVFDEAEPVEERMSALLQLLSTAPAADAVAREIPGPGGDGLVSGFTRDEYVSAVGSVKDYIVRGHVYQVNLSQRFETPFTGDPFELFKQLYRKNPAPFFAYVNTGDHQIVSTSPERFIQLNQQEVETRPIKGTRPRGKTPEDDERMRKELELSRKDDAELSMIVDLLRNDIGKVCRAGSVCVIEHKRVEAYENVFHLVSIVRGTLDSDKTAVDLIIATFPGGSITGCPKIRAMEVIDELEPVRRHLYTGSIGYVSFHGTMDLSIAIRTATITSGRLLFSVGGGIVYDSDPESEFEETLHKGQTLIAALELSPGSERQEKEFVWHNGKLRSKDSAFVSINDEGLLYGGGIFETIRVERGVPLMLEEHVTRFNRAWQYCFKGPPPDNTWQDIILQVVDKNGYSDGVAAVKILATSGTARRQFDGNLLVTAKPYVPRLRGTGRTALRLIVYPHPRHSPLAEHKTTNYLFCKMAGEWAKSQNADEALILNVDGSISETNTANVFWAHRGKVYRPSSPYALPGTMEGAVCRLLGAWHMGVESRRVMLQELLEAELVFVTNSLMGAVPVSQIEGRNLPYDSGLCDRINARLLSPTIDNYA